MLKRDPEKNPKRIISPNKTHEKDKRVFYVQTRPREETTTNSTENATPPKSTKSGNFKFLGNKTSNHTGISIECHLSKSDIRQRQTLSYVFEK